MSDKRKYFWKGFRKGFGQGAMFGSIFFGLGTYVLIGCMTSYLGMKVWIQESNNE